MVICVTAMVICVDSAVIAMVICVDNFFTHRAYPTAMVTFGIGGFERLKA